MIRKKRRQKFFSASSLLQIFDPGYEISGIRDKHHGSATLHITKQNLIKRPDGAAA
jgi:hypothetical protein